MNKELILVKNKIQRLKDKRALIDEKLETLLMDFSQYRSLHLKYVSSDTKNHPLCGWETLVIQKSPFLIQ